MVETLAKEIPTLIVWKDGQADIRRYQQIRYRVGDRLHWVGGAGDDMVPGYYSMGIRTYTSSISNVAPKLSLRLHELASASATSSELTKLMNDVVIPLYALRSRARGTKSSAMKAMMDELGLVGGKVARRWSSCGQDELQHVRHGPCRSGRNGLITVLRICTFERI